MSSAVYFKFRASLKQYTIPFEGSSISVKDLRNAIKLQCGLKSTDFELEIVDKQGKEYAKEDDLIPKFSDLVVRRVPKAADASRRKIHNPEDMTRRDPYKNMNSLPKINLLTNTMNLAHANIPEDEKIDIVTRYSEENTDKSYLVKPKPYGVPPANYVCNKCHQGGHWIYECPGVRDKDGRYIDSKAVKRPTGIPQDFLLEVTAGTPGAYLTKEGKYMVPIKDAEAYAQGKREKRPFSQEENPPLIEKESEIPEKLKCPICKNLLTNPMNTPCCQSIYCGKCIRDYLYDPEVNGNRECANCQTTIQNRSQLLENETVPQLIICYKAGLLTKEFIDECVRTPAIKVASIKKTELLLNDKVNCEFKFSESSNSPVVKEETATKSDRVSPSTNSDLKTGSGVNNTETNTEEKVFINNRRILKPKGSIKSEPDLSKNLSSNSLPELAKSQDKTDVSQPPSTTSVDTKTMSQSVTTSSDIKDAAPVNVKVAPIIKKEVDENELIFGRVVDTGSIKSKQQILNQIKNESTSKPTVTVTSNDNNDSTRSSHRYDRRHHHYDNQRHSSSYNQRNSGMQHVPNPHINSVDLAKTLQVFSSMIANPKPPTLLNANSVLPNQLQPQPASMSTMDHIQWSLLNNMIMNQATNNVGNSINLANVPNLVSNGTISNKICPPGAVGNVWKSSDQPNTLEYDVTGHPITTNNLDLPNATNINDFNSYAKRILSKQEFYEYQRRLRAEQLKRHSRSPSGSQSPIKRQRRDNRYSRSRYNYSHRHRRSRSYEKHAKNGEYRSGEWKSPSPTTTIQSQPQISSSHHRHHSNRSQDTRGDHYKKPRVDKSSRHEHQSHRSSHRSSSSVSRNRQKRRYTIDERRQTNELSSQLLATVSNSQNDIKNIDPKLVQDSINTFLKYLKGSQQASNSDSSSHSQHQSPREKDSKISAPDSDKLPISPLTKDTTHKHQSSLNNDRNITSPTPPRQITIVRPYEHYVDDGDQSRHDDKDNTVDCSLLNNKKVKKSKKKSRNSDDDSSSKKKHKKHKKHKHKKNKKVKKEKQNSE